MAGVTREVMVKEDMEVRLAFSSINGSGDFG